MESGFEGSYAEEIRKLYMTDVARFPTASGGNEDNEDNQSTKHRSGALVHSPTTMQLWGRFEEELQQALLGDQN